jgi:hypothetical protein
MAGENFAILAFAGSNTPSIILSGLDIVRDLTRSDSGDFGIVPRRPIRENDAVIAFFTRFGCDGRAKKVGSEHDLSMWGITFTKHVVIKRFLFLLPFRVLSCHESIDAI